MFVSMSAVEASIEAIRRVHKKLGTVEFARRAGVAYTTVHDCQRRDFVGPSVETLLKLAATAEEIERSGDVAGEAAA